jgi:aspartate kinase
VVQGGEARHAVRAVTCERQLLVLEATGGLSLLPPLLELLDQLGIKGRLLAFDGLGGAGGFLALPLHDVHALGGLKEALRGALGEKVRVREDLGTVTCVGSGVCAEGKALRTALGLAAKRDIVIHAAHGSALQLSLVVERAHLDGLTRALHEALVEGRQV